HASSAGLSRGQDRKPIEATPGCLTSPPEAAIFETPDKPLHGSGGLACLVSPILPRPKKIARLRPCACPALASFLGPPRDGIFLLKIGTCCRCYGFRRHETAFLPFQATRNRPGEDARPFGPEAFCQCFVPFLRRDGNGEGDEVETTSNGFVD